MNGSFRFAHFSTHHMPVSAVLRPRYFSSMYGDDVRLGAKELAGIYRGLGGNVPDHFALILFLGDLPPDDVCTDIHDECCVITRRIVTESAVVSSQFILDYMDEPPVDTKWATILSWSNAVLTCLGFVWEPSE